MKVAESPRSARHHHCSITAASLLHRIITVSCLFPSSQPGYLQKVVYVGLSLSLTSVLPSSGCWLRRDGKWDLDMVILSLLLLLLMDHGHAANDGTASVAYPSGLLLAAATTAAAASTAAALRWPHLLE